MRSACLITVRLKSTRLPRKALLPLRGRPLLSHLVDRMTQWQPRDQIWICTSVLPTDDELETYARTQGLRIFRGDPDDVLVRLRDACRTAKADVAVSVTGDNPCVDPETLQEQFRFHCESQMDYTKSDGLPWGAFGYCLSASALERVCEIKKTRDTEIWGPFFTQAECFRWGTWAVTDAAVREPSLRLTVDTPDDFTFVEKLLSHFDTPLPSLRHLIERTRNLPKGTVYL